MKNLKNALLLKQLYQLKQLGYNYTSATIYKDDEQLLRLPNTLSSLQKQAMECHLCELSKTRQKVVFGEGNENADILFVGDSPTIAEDSTGRVFEGRTGELLTKMIENVLLLTKEDVYIANILKCKPFNGDIPTPTQAHTCHPYLLKQIELIKPKLVVALGEVAYHYLTGDDAPLEKIRGLLHKQNDYTLIATYHPSYLLRNPSAKKEVFADLLKVKALMDAQKEAL